MDRVATIDDDRLGVCPPAISSSGNDEPVRIQPGATEFTVTPCRATSGASPRFSPSTAAFAAPFPTLSGIATSGPVVEDTFTIRP
jgi:hypothetical protein